MPGTGPKLIIVAKKEMIGEEMPDFDGDSFVDAKKKMMMKVRRMKNRITNQRQKKNLQNKKFLLSN